MYRKKVRRLRSDPLSDRGGSEPVTQFGERISTDFIIVQKLASDKETLQVIRNEFSGWIRAYPITKLDASTLLKNLLFHPSQVANGASAPFLAFIWGPLPFTRRAFEGGA